MNICQYIAVHLIPIVAQLACSAVISFVRNAFRVIFGSEIAKKYGKVTQTFPDLTTVDLADKKLVVYQMCSNYTLSIVSSDLTSLSTKFLVRNLPDERPVTERLSDIRLILKWREGLIIN